MTAGTVAVRNLAHRYLIEVGAPGALEALRFLACDPEVAGPAPPQSRLAVRGYGDFLRLEEDGKEPRDFIGLGALRDHLHARFLLESLSGTWPMLHAACLTRAGGRVLLVGPKGSGKSTLSLALALAGFAIEGDENVFLTPGGVLARPRACRVKEGTLTVLPALAPLVAEAAYIVDYLGRRIYSLPPDRLCGDWRISEGPAQAVILLHGNHGGLSSLRPVSPLALSRALLMETGLPTAGRAVGIAALSRLGGTARGWDLSVGRLEEAVACVEAALAESCCDPLTATLV